MQQQTLFNFKIRKNVQTASGRWLRDHSPTHIRAGLPCTICGQRFKSKQGLVSHRKHAHKADDEIPVVVPTHADHWAWRFLQGAQPHADDQEPVVVPDDEEPQPKMRKITHDNRCGAQTRKRYTALQKLHAVDHWLFARESGLEYHEAVILSYKKRVRVCDGLHFLMIFELSRKRVVIVRVFVS